MLGMGIYLFSARVELLERLQLLYECLVLVLQDGHAVLQTLDVLLLLPPTLTGRLPAKKLKKKCVIFYIYFQFAAFVVPVLHQPHLPLLVVVPVPALVVVVVGGGGAAARARQLHPSATAGAGEAVGEERRAGVRGGGAREGAGSSGRRGRQVVAATTGATAAELAGGSCGSGQRGGEEEGVAAVLKINKLNITKLKLISKVRADLSYGVVNILQELDSSLL